MAGVYSTVDRMPDSFETLWYAWYKRIAVYCTEFSNLSHEDREEAVADILHKAWHARSRHDGRHALSTWIYRIARNHLLNLVRHSKRHGTHFASSPDSPDWPVDLSHAYRPDTACINSETLVEVRSLVAALPPESRELVYLLYAECMSIRDISALCGLSESAVKSRLHRIRGYLRKALEEQNEERS